ncbi:MAG: hypothetical protein WC952_10775 [Desulfobulbaceae bacterium]
MRIRIAIGDRFFDFDSNPDFDEMAASGDEIHTHRKGFRIEPERGMAGWSSGAFSRRTPPARTEL